MPLRPEDDKGCSIHTRIREYLGERLYTLAEKTNYPLNERFVLPCVLQALNRTGIDAQADLAGGYFCTSPVTLHIDDITVHIRGSGVLSIDEMLGNFARARKGAIVIKPIMPIYSFFRSSYHKSFLLKCFN